MDKFVAVIKYFCKKGMSPKEIHDDFIKTLRNKPPSYSTVKKWATEFSRGRESVEDYERSGSHKEATIDENVALVPSLIIGMSKISARWSPDC